MAAEPEILDELRRLRARVPHLTGSLAASVDGLVLAQDTAEVEPDSIAALTAAALGVALRLTKATGQGEFRELVLRGENGYVATYAAGSSAVLTVLAEPRANVGRLHLEARRSGARIAFLTDRPARGDRSTTRVVRSGDGHAGGAPEGGEPSGDQPQDGTTRPDQVHRDRDGSTTRSRQEHEGQQDHQGNDGQLVNGGHQGNDGQQDHQGKDGQGANGGHRAQESHRAQEGVEEERAASAGGAQERSTTARERQTLPVRRPGTTPARTDDTANREN